MLSFVQTYSIPSPFNDFTAGETSSAPSFDYHACFGILLPPAFIITISSALAPKMWTCSGVCSNRAVIAVELLRLALLDKMAK